MRNPVLRGIASVVLVSSDLASARAWYAEFLGLEPHYETAAYVEFRFGDYEQDLGIVGAKFARGPDPRSIGPSGATVYWHVEDVRGVFDRALKLGARLHEPPRDLGHGLVTATVIDPFGNILGFSYNPHYAEMRCPVLKD